MLVSFSGSQSSGKSTLLRECKHLYEDQYSFVDEITRKISKEGLPINEQGSDVVQLKILQSHIENSKLTNTFLDRCIIDGYIYTRYLYETGTVSKSILDYAQYLHNILMPKYDKIFYTSPAGVPLVDDGVRSVNHAFRDAIIQLYNEYMAVRDISKFVILEGSVIERLKIILKHVPHDHL